MNQNGEVEDRKPIPWRFRDVVYVVVAWVAVVVLVASLFGEHALTLPILVLAVGALGFLTVAWVAVRFGGARLLLGAEFTVRPRALILGALVGLVALLLQVATLLVEDESAGPPATPPTDGLLAPGQPAWMLIIGLVVIVPISEELFFRGLLLGALRRSFGPITSTLLVGMGFGLLHLEGAGMEAALSLVRGVVTGVAYTWLMTSRSNLTLPVAAHATNNLVAVAIALLARAV